MDLERACIVLGVERGTPVDEARKRYRARARLLHPDVASSDALRGEAAQAFKELNAAWEIYKQHGLSDGQGATGTRRPETSDPQSQASEQSSGAAAAQSQDPHPSSARASSLTSGSPARPALWVLGFCVCAYVMGVATLGAHTEAENKAKFGAVFSDAVVNSRIFGAINRHFVAVGHDSPFGGAGAKSDSGPTALESDLTPSGWVRVEEDGYSYAIPKSWSARSDPDWDTSADGPAEVGDFIIGSRESRDAAFGEFAKRAMAELKEEEGTKDFNELGPITVATDGDGSTSGQGLSSVRISILDGTPWLEFIAVIDIGKNEALTFIVNTMRVHDQDAVAAFCERVMGTFVVKG